MVFRQNITDDSCRVCKSHPETVMHLLSACPFYAPNAYIHRHNAALRVLYYHLRHKYGIDKTPVLPYAPGDIASVVENEKCRIYWNMSIATTRQLTATKPDITLFDLEHKVIYLVEFSAPAERNIIIKEDEKHLKYQDLMFELRRLHPGFAVRLVILIIGVLGGINTTFLGSLSVLPHCKKQSKYLADAMQKAVIMGSLRVLRSHDTRQT